MQHLVEQDVFDGIARHPWVVEDAADDDGVVRGVVVAEAAPGVVLAPGELRASHEPVEEATVKVLENFLKMVVMATGGVDVFASAHLSDETGFGGDVIAANVAAITGAVHTINRLAIKFGKQNVGNRVQYGFRGAFEQIGDANVELALAQ